MNKDDGGSAFPVLKRIKEDGYPAALIPCDGMSLRDYFAAKAMQAMLSSCETATQSLSAMFIKRNIDPDVCIAQMAYEYADAMLAERSKP